MKIPVIILCVLAATISASAVGSSVEVPTPTANGVEMQGLAGLTAEDLIAHKPRELARKYGVKLKLKQRLALSVVRGKLKKAKRKGLDVNEVLAHSGSGSGFHFGGFLLGFFLGLLGWLLAILIWPRMGAGRSALLGFAIWLIVAIILFA